MDHGISYNVVCMLQDQKENLGVRLAVGETNIITETRDFLTSHGVKLDVFSQVNLSIRHLLFV